MSSVKSPAPTPADLYDAVQAALVEVSENAFFVFVEPCGGRQFASLVDRVASGNTEPVTAAPSSSWLKASVAFVGSFSGTVEIALPERLGSWLVSSLLGLPPEKPLAEDQMFDGVGEFANMVCGTWLSRLGVTSMFELRMPAVTRMAPAWSPVSEAPGASEMACRMVTLNDSPMRVRVLA